jgi:hypothetical protein
MNFFGLPVGFLTSGLDCFFFTIAPLIIIPIGRSAAAEAASPIYCDTKTIESMI